MMSQQRNIMKQDTGKTEEIALTIRLIRRKIEAHHRVFGEDPKVIILDRRTALGLQNEVYRETGVGYSRVSQITSPHTFDGISVFDRFDVLMIESMSVED